MNTNTPLQWPMNLLASDRQDPLAGRATLERWRLFFQAGDVEVALPWTGIRVHTAGGEEDQVFFSHPDFQNFTFFTEDAAILNDPAFQQVIDLRRQVAHFDEQAKAKGFRRTTLIFLLCFAVLTGFLFVAANAVVHLAVRNFPAEWEADIGNQALLEIAAQSSIDRNSEKALELTKLVHRIAPRRGDRDKLKVFLLNEAHPNAFAVPGGTILVTTGLLEMTEEPAEIAGVLAHEIAHIQQRHGLRIYVKAAGPAYALRILLGDRGSGKAIASTSTFLLMQRFSRDHELAADASAVKLLERGGFDPNGLADFLKRLMAYSGEALAPEILLSHPPTPERLQALKKLVSE